MTTLNIERDKQGLRASFAHLGDEQENYLPRTLSVEDEYENRVEGPSELAFDWNAEYREQEEEEILDAGQVPFRVYESWEGEAKLYSPAPSSPPSPPQFGKKERQKPRSIFLPKISTNKIIKKANKIGYYLPPLPRAESMLDGRYKLEQIRNSINSEYNNVSHIMRKTGYSFQEALRASKGEPVNEGICRPDPRNSYQAKRARLLNGQLLEGLGVERAQEIPKEKMIVPIMAKDMPGTRSYYKRVRPVNGKKQRKLDPTWNPPSAEAASSYTTANATIATTSNTNIYSKFTFGSSYYLPKKGIETEKRDDSGNLPRATYFPEGMPFDPRIPFTGRPNVGLGYETPDAAPRLRPTTKLVLMEKKLLDGEVGHWTVNALADEYKSGIWSQGPHDKYIQDVFKAGFKTWDNCFRVDWNSVGNEGFYVMTQDGRERQVEEWLITINVKNGLVQSTKEDILKMEEEGRNEKALGTAGCEEEYFIDLNRCFAKERESRRYGNCVLSPK